ncbi:MULTISPECIES: DinB family protein [unclassified Paenibacillus]|uniref:DinB family protein n=1 Tax=unclassified Paenibacillus TaxID=185978 RepID=UPI001AEB5A0A|nr:MULTISPECIES: DinB family protein [unclassified Paenibacillus]MBP1156412.1 hypothetical protein [Paenibacillus sp. PvP091]MBP1168202.1 hypothetical protein [Paenibacillus sp. PvR098]MBP2439230.1 hypothetical protein [Paenibacillus sp. PvP052]
MSLALHTEKVVRQITIAKIEAISEEFFDVQPPQFNNTIRWNLGHIVSATDGLIFQRISQTSHLPEGFADLFRGGTKPADWTTTPPTKAELIELLKSQVHILEETFANRLGEKLPEPLQIRDLSFSTVEEVINFASMHETMHSTIVSDMLKIIQHQSK